MIAQRNVHRLQRGFRFAALLLMSISLFSTVQIAQAAVFQPGCSNGVGDTAALQAAFSTASNNGADDTIQLVAGCTYTLTATLTADLTDGKTLTIEGNDAVISGNNAVRVLKVLAGSTVIINRTKLNKGFTDEPGNSDGEGAGIANKGTLTLNSSTVSGSLATSGGGGGILNDQGTLTLNKTTISGNTLNGGDGGGILSKEGTLTITNSTISGNTATNGGGGIYTDSSTVQVTGSTISGNTADWGGGLANLGTTTVTKSIISDNTAVSSGGGIDNGGSLTLLDTAVSGNDVSEGDGGGILSANGGTLSVTNSTLSGNTSGNWGGGIAVFGVTATLTNSTLFNNTSSFGGGAANNSTATLNLIHVTISGNTSGAVNQGGGLYNEGIVNLTNSILANSGLGGDCFNNAGTITPTSVNLVEDGSCTILNAIAGDPMLGNAVSQPAYLPLLVGSPALDVGVNDAVNCPDTDQRGEVRPQDGNNDGNPICDLGAFELGMVVNGGFEDGANGWTISNVATDKVKCNKPTKQIAHGGQCTFVFKGGPGANSKLTQTITGVNLLAGSNLQLTLFYWGKGDAISGKAKLRVKYTDGTETGKINLDLSANGGYVEAQDDILIGSAAINKIKLQVNNSSAAGKLYIDDASLAQAASPIRLIPLP